MIYDMMLDRCDKVFVTKIFSTFEADRYFRNMDEDENFVLTWESDVMEENGLSYKFTLYERK